MTSKNKYRLTYFTDILCGWCFGFSPTISRIHHEYSDRLDFNVVSGGLFLDDWEELVKKDAPHLENGSGETSFVLGVKPAGLINDVASHIKAGAYKEVEAATGVKFGEDFLKELEKGTMRLNSLYPAMALCIVREKLPEKAVELTSSLLSAIYYDGMHPEDVPAYESYVSKVGFDVDEFNAKMADPLYKAKAMEDFKNYCDQPVHGFPSLLLEKGDEKIVIFTSSKDFDQISKSLDQHLQ